MAADLVLPAAAPEEAAAFYHGYLKQIPDGRVGARLRAQIAELEALCGGLSDAAARSRYAEGKWTVKEVVGHLLDAERIFAYRLLRIGRGDDTPLSGFDENAYVPEGQFNLRPIDDLVNEFALQRRSTLALANGIPAAAWTRAGTANGLSITARALVYVILGHTAHHVAVLRGRYGLDGAIAPTD